MKKTKKFLLTALIGLTTVFSTLGFTSCQLLFGLGVGAGIGGALTSTDSSSSCNHVYETETVPPTCTESGYTVYTCACGYSYNGDVVKPWGHTEVVDVAIASTCTKTGLTEGLHCSVCSTVIVKQEETPILEHSYVGNTCSVCKYQKPSEGLAYSLNDDGESYCVMGIGTCTDTDLIIPSTHEDLPVTSIGKEAFRGNNRLKRVVIPDSITSVGEGVFRACPILTSVEIGNGLTSTSNYMFYDCPRLNNVVIPDSVTQIAIYSFYNCDSLTSIKIPDRVIWIGEYAFQRCDNLTSVIIGNSVHTICTEAFGYCSSLTNVIIGNSVTTIQVRGFYNCYNLTSIYYHGTKNYWSYIDIGANNQFTNATRYYYSESEPTTEGNYWHYDENGEVAVW